MPSEPDSVDAPSPIPTDLETTGLTVRFYARDPDRIVVVFASAGARRINGFAEEFRGSFWPTGASMMFVTDKAARWYNHPDTERVFRHVADIAAGYRHVAAIGESLGACGAILFTNYAANVDRVVALAPQYSVTPPFIRFDDRYRHIGETITDWFFNDFSRCPVKDKVVMIYGNSLWRDYLHRAMYLAAGFGVLLIEDAPHEIAAHLKSAYPANQLRRLADLLCDFSQPFSAATLRAGLPVAWTDQILLPSALPVPDPAGVRATKAEQAAQPVLPPVLWPLISSGKPATQSSISQWSWGRTVEADAMRALDGDIAAAYNFHTDSEVAPWWMIDLLDPHQVCQIRIFNRIDNPHVARRCLNFSLRTSMDGVAWTEVLRKDDSVYFGGADGQPFIHTPVEPWRCRFVRIVLIGEGFLHLNQVQIFGVRV